MKSYYLLASLAMLCACNSQSRQTEAAGNSSGDNSDTQSAIDFVTVEDSQPPNKTNLEEMRLQVLLDRAGFSPGVIDGRDGKTLKLALRGFQQSRALEPSENLDDATSSALSELGIVSATRMVRIPANFAHQSFVRTFPKDASSQANLPTLGYHSLMEALAERFHTTTDTLIALNSPNTLIGSNRIIRVPNIAEVSKALPKYVDRGWSSTLRSLAVDATQPQAARIVVDKSEGVLKVFDKSERLIAQFPATMGSKHDPLPLGRWKIQGISRNPDFHYNPKLFWDVSDKKEAVLLKPGPNGPVGVVWLDLSKPHFGIHGTSEPQTIGRAESHGCVRLTNWDAARLAQMVTTLSIPAKFQS